MNRPIMSVLATSAALLALTGLAAVSDGDARGGQARAGGESQTPVERTELTCPRPADAISATTDYTAFTPPPTAGNAGDSGSARLLPAPEYAPGLDDAGEDGQEGREGGDGEQQAPEDAEPVAPVQEPGAPVGQRVTGADAPALTGVADGALAPGWTVQQTTRVEFGTGRGLLGTSCRTPDTAFWFPGASTAEERHDYVHLANPDPAATVVDIELYGPEGRIEAEAGEGITVPGHSAVPVLLSTLTDEETDSLAVHVTARTGRIGAQVEAVDEDLGADWLAPALPPGPGGTLVLPGIPADAREVRLTAVAPGEEDVTLDVGLAGPSGTIVPAGNETVSVDAGAVVSVDLGQLTQGETGSLVLTPAAGSGVGYVAAALQVVLGEDGDGPQEMAFISATAPVGQRASAAGNTARGTELTLTAPGRPVEVEVTLSAGTDGGEVVTESYSIEGETTLALVPELPEGTEGRYALTITSEGGPVYAARTLSIGGDEPMLTIQTLSDDDSVVTVPSTEQDLSILAD